LIFRTHRPPRAVAPGTGYLYIRTIGGPTGTDGPFYGPFTLASGQTFTSTEIPAGSYDGIGVLYATEPLDNLTTEWEGQTMTFTELMRLPDDDFALITDGGEEEGQEKPFDLLLDGLASGELLENVTIVENENNTLSLTLVPICGSSIIAMSETPENNVYTETGDADRLIRKFIELDNILLPEGYDGNMVATISAAGAPFIGNVAMFDEDGRQVGSTAAINATLSADREISVPWTGGETYYLYIEYRTETISLAFSSDPEPDVVIEGDITLEVNVGETHAERKLLAGIYPDTSESPPEDAPVAVSVIDLDSSGTGTGTLVTTGTTDIHSFESGAWTLTAFIDTNNNYSDILVNEPLTTIVGIEPHHGDYTFETPLTTDGIESLNYGISGEDLIVCENRVYYLAQTGNGDGQRIDNAMAYEDFFSNVLPEVTTGDEVYAYIIEDITSSCPIILSSVDPSQPRSFILDSTSFFEVGTESMVVLRDITLRGDSTECYFPLVSLNGQLVLDKNTLLQTRTNGEGPGGIDVQDGGTLVMNDLAVIEDCHSTSNGGGVSLYSGNMATSFTMNGGTIMNCTADSYGGGIHAYGVNPSITMSGGTIENCEATMGGGIALESNASLELSGSAQITTNATTLSEGWGLYYDSGGSEFITPSPTDTEILDFFDPQTDAILEGEN